MENVTNQESIGTFKAEPQSPIVDNKEVEAVSTQDEPSKNHSNDDLQGLINNRDALIREKRSAKDEAAGFKSQLEDMGNVNVTLNKRIDDLLVDSLVSDVVRLIKPVEGAEAFVMSEIRKQISLGTIEDQRSALIENNLTTNELAEQFKLNNKAIVYGVDSSGAGTTQGRSTGSLSTGAANLTSNQFGLK